MEIKLSKCTVRHWQRSDEPSLAQHANNYKIWRNVRDRFPHPYTLEDAQRWLEHVTLEDPVTSFAIVVDGEAAGGIGLILREDIYHRSAEIGYWLSEDYWGRGVMTEAVRGVCAWAFGNFDLCRIYAGVLDWNPGSARVLEKAGFQFEGRLRNAVTKEGVTMDELVYALIRE